MKGLLLATLLALPSVSLAQVTWVGPDCVLSWDPNSPDELVQGYRVYTKQINPLVINEQSVGLVTKTTCSTLGLTQGKYEAHVTAYNPAGESGPSNVVPFVLVTSVPGTPGGVTPPINLKVEMPPS